MLADPDPRAAQLSRDYRLQVQVDPAPALHVLGGKLTTYRVLAEEALDLLRPALPQMGPAWTARGDPLPGSDWGDAAQACSRLLALHRGCPQYRATLGRGLWQSQRGTAAGCIRPARSGRGLRRGACMQREVDFLREREWACDTDDILWRRSKLGLRLDAAQGGTAAGVDGGSDPFSTERALTPCCHVCQPRLAATRAAARDGSMH